MRQFTGLVDLNGTEVYEGDIVEGINEHVGFLERQEVKGVVDYSSKLAMFLAVAPKGGECPLYHLTELRVVGNIHDHVRTKAEKVAMQTSDDDVPSLPLT